MDLSRQGEHERGFSMMLGRVFDPRDTGLLLTVVRARTAARRPCASSSRPRASTASPSTSCAATRATIPTGCSTSPCARPSSTCGPAATTASASTSPPCGRRSPASRGDGTVQRAERWFLKRLSNFAQIESLWRFNAKYEPEWLPRYVVFDTAEHLVPVVMAILRAESVWEIPVLGRLLAASAGRRSAACLGGDTEGEPAATGEAGERTESALAPDDQVPVRP